MQMLDLKHITLTGELAFRLGRNFSRLEDPMYRAPEIFQADQQGWPGDWEGRTMLALCLHEQLSGRKAAFLDDVLEALEARWNEKGYLGEIYPYGVINEQQLAGNNWLLRRNSIVNGKTSAMQKGRHALWRIFIFRCWGTFCLILPIRKNGY